MKRPKKYSHRPGMRFDRRHVKGPDAGFLGADIDVTAFTGSVEKSVTQSAGIYRYPSVPFAGYPKSSYEMQLIALGSGTWVGGYLLDEHSGDAENSFDQALPLIGFGDITYRDIGPRGPADDYAMGFSTDGVTPMLTGSIGQYALTSDSDIAILWAGRQTGVSNPGYVFSSTGSSGIGGAGWSLRAPSIVDDLVEYRLHLNPDGMYASAPQFMFHYFPYKTWYLGLFTYSRGANSASLASFNLSDWSGSVTRASIGGGTGSLNGETQKFRVGSMAEPGFLSQGAAEIAISGLFIASGSDAAEGIIGNEIAIMRSFATALMARDAFRFSGSAEIDRSLTAFGTAPESAYVTQQLLGLSTASLGRARGVSIITTGSIPSWTNVHIRNSSFVSTTLSSSDHESQVLGYFRSGTQAVETSPVPASASMYYSKFGRYRNVTVKKTASELDLARLPTDMDGGTPVYYVPDKGTDITTVTGTLAYFPQIKNFIQRSSVLFPAMIPIDVNYQGKIVDVKVWIELMQTSGSTATDGAGAYPLGNLAIAIRSPNVRGFHAHPIRNDAAIKKVFTSDLSEFSSAGAFGAIGRSLFGPDYIAPFYRDSFILWEGPGIFGEGSVGPWDTDTEGEFTHFVTNKYPCWQRDRSMRTVFSDGASIPNPRHHIGTSMSGNYVGSPNHNHGFSSAYGFDVPWTSETEISGANTYASAGSPPKGWLNGPGGTNLEDEWPTTGSNYGADYIKPFYPMLDPLYQRKRYGDVVRKPSTGSAQFDPGKWTGFRPGLRGTEVSGTWYLIVADTRESREVGDYTPTYMRQVRLEFTLASGSYADASLHRQSKLMARKSGREVLVATISGSDLLYDATGSWDAHISDTFLYQESTSGRGPDAASEISRTIGIGFLTGSAESGDFALLYRVTGSLADLSGTNPGWLFNNQFGTPAIPLSSASLVDHGVQPITTIHPQDILSDRGILNTAVRIGEAAQDVNPPTTRAEAFERAIISLNEEEE